MSAKAEKRKLTPPEVARIWGVASSKVCKFIRTGELRAINLAESGCHRPRYVIDIADIERFEEQRRVVPDGGLSTTKILRRKAASGVKDFF